MFIEIYDNNFIDTDKEEKCKNCKFKNKSHETCFLCLEWGVSPEEKEDGA